MRGSLLRIVPKRIRSSVVAVVMSPTAEQQSQIRIALIAVLVIVLIWKFASYKKRNKCENDFDLDKQIHDFEARRDALLKEAKT